MYCWHSDRSSPGSSPSGSGLLLLGPHAIPASFYCGHARAMGGWAALCVLLLFLASQARPAAAALQLGQFPKGPPYDFSIDYGPGNSDVALLNATDPDYPTQTNPFLMLYAHMDKWWQDEVDETLIIPKGQPLGKYFADYGVTLASAYETDGTFSTSPAPWSLSDDLTLRVQTVSPQTAHRIGGRTVCVSSHCVAWPRARLRRVGQQRAVALGWPRF